MSYAEVAVNSPAARRRSYSYKVPRGLDLAAGHAVWVPFGSRVMQGVVVEVNAVPQVDETKEICSVVGDGPVLRPLQVALGRWISEHYLAPLFDSLSLMLPPGFERRPVAVFETVTDAVIPSELGPDHVRVLELAGSQGPLTLKDIARELGKSAASRVSTQLVKAGLLRKKQVLQGLTVRSKIVRCISLAVPVAEASDAAASLKASAATRRQAVLLEALAGTSPLPLSDLQRLAGVSVAVARTLVRKGLAALMDREVSRDPLAGKSFGGTCALELTPAQESAWRTLEAGMNSCAPGRGRTFLLHGVTGSGKTELYLRALQATVARGKRGVVLVPEISLTPQTIERFCARFPGRVAVLHSRLSIGERYDEWRRIRQGDFDVVVGPRGALFAPQPDLGLIILDEEHDWSYKQQEQDPRYHARDVALKMSELCGAMVVLGSATPDVETYYRAVAGEYVRLVLPERVSAWGRPEMPAVEIADMREELRAGNRSIFSRSLRHALEDTLEKRHQAIIFLNRRGASSFVQCRNCGYVARCRRCDANLTHHALGEALVCHQCNSRYPVPVTCPRCFSRHIRFLGIGTQKVEQLTREAFPGARTLRWDRDTSRGKWSDEETMHRFLEHKADILIGTQLIAKGLDMPRVTLVGVINADLGLYLPDFRASERTFQLLCQVAGRAGRGKSAGRAVIQTYNPEHYAIRGAALQDYERFYLEETRFRRAHGEPPFARLVRLVYSHTVDDRCRQEAERLAREVADLSLATGIAVDTIGPAPTFVRRLRGKYRWHFLLRGNEAVELLRNIRIPAGWTIDIDPASVA